MARHVGQPALNTVVVETQPFVVESHEVQNGGVEIADAGDIHDGSLTQFIRRAAAEAGLHVGTASQMVKPLGLRSRRIRPRRVNRRADGRVVCRQHPVLGQQQGQRPAPQNHAAETEKIPTLK